MKKYFYYHKNPLDLLPGGSDRSPTLRNAGLERFASPISTAGHVGQCYISNLLKEIITIKIPHQQRQYEAAPPPPPPSTTSLFPFPSNPSLDTRNLQVKLRTPIDHHISIYIMLPPLCYHLPALPACRITRANATAVRWWQLKPKI